jgi:hypothetical protein
MMRFVAEVPSEIGEVNAVIDYYPLIRRAVCALESNTQDERHALYERVRNALAGMLLASDPSPTETEIVDECLALDTAINRVEAPYTFLDSLTHLPAHARAALRSALDVMRETDTPLTASRLAGRSKEIRSTLNFGERMPPNSVASAAMTHADSPISCRAASFASNNGRSLLGRQI